MREFAKSLFSFSWAMSLFGARQLAKLAMPPDQKGQLHPATEAFNAVTQATTNQLGDTMEATFKAGDSMQRGMVDMMFNVLPLRAPGTNPSSSDPRQACGATVEPKSSQQEEVITRYTEGRGRFTETGKIVLTTTVYKPNGEEDGHYEATFDVSNLLNPQMANAWYQWFNLPIDDYFDPYKPDQTADPMEVRAQTEVRWTLADGSSITAAGPAFFNLARFKDGSSIFFITTAASIRNGSAKFEGAVGTSVSLGSARIEKGSPFGPGSEFATKTVESFRVIRRSQIEVPSPAWRYQLKTIEVKDKRGQSFDMSYVDVGAGDPIVFLHGNPSWSYVWRNIIPFLEPLGRCIAPDLIGMGPLTNPAELTFTYSDHLQFINDFIEKMGLKNITFVVHDWGTALGFDYASRNETNVKGLAFMEAVYKSYPNWKTFPEADAPQLVRENFKAFREGFPNKNSFGYKMIVDKNAFIDLLTPTVMGRAVTQEEMKWDREPFKEPKSREVIWRWVNQIPIEGVPESTTKAVDGYHQWLLRTTLPKLLLYVSPGMILTADSVKWLSENLTNLTLVNVGPGLHYPQETNPHLVGTELAKWCRSLSAGGRA